VPLDRNAKVRVMMVARALMRHQEKGKAHVSRDNLDENGGGNQSLKRRPVAEL
jgi:hypothetical protein